MKNIITAALLMIAFSASAQSLVKIKSQFLADSITMLKNGKEIRPIVTTLNGDTTRSITYQACSVYRDTTIGFTVTVSSFDKKGNYLNSYIQTVPGNFFTKWAAFINKLDLYILAQKPRIQAN